MRNDLSEDIKDIQEIKKQKAEQKRLKPEIKLFAHNVKRAGYEEVSWCAKCLPN